MNDATWGIRHIDETGATSYAEEPGTICAQGSHQVHLELRLSNVMMGQHADINDCLRIYNLPDEEDSGVRMIVTVDAWLTPTALVSDIILPGTTPFEEDDLTTGGSAWTGFVCCESAAIEPLFEAKPVYEICTLIAEKLGIARRVHRGQNPARLGSVVLRAGQGGRRRPSRHLRGVPFDRPVQADRRARAGHRRAREAGHAVGQVRGVLASRRTTSRSSGTSPAAVTCPTTGATRSPACPSTTTTSRVTTDPLRSAYPFQLIGHHTKTRTHSSYGNVDVDEVGGAAAVLDQREGRGRAWASSRTTRSSCPPSAAAPSSPPR